MTAKWSRLLIVILFSGIIFLSSSLQIEAQYSSCTPNGYTAGTTTSCSTVCDSNGCNYVCGPASTCCSGYESGGYCADPLNTSPTPTTDPTAGCLALHGVVWNDTNRNGVFDQTYAWINGTYTYTGESGWGAGVPVNVAGFGTFYTDQYGNWSTYNICYVGNLTVTIVVPQNSVLDAARMLISPSGVDNFQTNFDSTTITVPWSGNSNNSVQFGLFHDNWPHLDNTSISPKPIAVNATSQNPSNASQYTITIQATDADGVSDIGSMYGLINYLDSNGNYRPSSDYRGYLGWSTPAQNFPWWCGSAQCSGLTNYKSFVNDTSGGGAACALNSGYGSDYINLISCTSRVSGNTRYVDFVVTFNNNFTSPLTGNSISGWAEDINAQYPTGWWVFDNFNLAAPIGNYDYVSNYTVVNDGRCAVDGWAFDPNIPGTSINVHVYKDVNPDGTGGTFVNSYPTNLLRQDVNNAYSSLYPMSGNHGFSINFDGTSGFYDGNPHRITLYGIGSFQNASFGGSPRTIQCATPPVSCSSAGPDGTEVAYNSTTYTVYAYGVQNASQVLFAVWTDVNGQDDLVWYSGTNQGGGTWAATINPSAHSGNGLVNVHAYMVNYAGAYSFCDTANFIKNVPPDSVNATINPKPVITNGVTQYTITITGTDANGGNDLQDMYALVNYKNLDQSFRPNTDYRGYIGWSSVNFDGWGAFKGGSPQACTAGSGAAAGGRFGVNYDGSGYYGGNYINIVPGTCTTTVSGNQRTVTFNVTFDPSFTTPTTGNTLSGYVQDSIAGYGWLATDSFDLGIPSGTISASPNPCTITTGNTYCTSTITWSTTNAPTAAVSVQDTGVGGSEVLYGVAPSASTNAPWIAASPHSYTFRLYNNGIGSTLLASVVVTGVIGHTLRGNLYVDPGDGTCTTAFSPSGANVQVFSSGTPGPSSGPFSGNSYIVTATSGNSAVLQGIPGGYYVEKVNYRAGGFSNYSNFTYSFPSPDNLSSSDLTLDWCVKNTGGNIYIGGGDVREGTINDPVPIGKTAAAANSAFFSSTAGTISNFGGTSSVPTWIINGEFGYNADPKNKNGLFSYTFFMNRSRVKQVTVNNMPGCPTGGAACTLALSTIASTGIYHTDGDLTIPAAGWNQTAGAHTLFLVNGDVYIKGPIKVAPGVGSLFIIAAKKNIYVDPSVGLSSIYTPGPCSDNSCTSMEGIYTAENNIVIQSNASCPGTSDKQLNFGGAFVVNALKPFKVTGPGAFKMQRTLCTNDPNYPVLTIQPRYDFIPQLTDFYKIPSVRWKEVNP